MSTIRLPEFRLIGIKLPRKTTNKNGQSGIDCGALWQKFQQEGIPEKIPGRLSDEIYAVYFGYEGDHTAPFSYFIGCKVTPGTPVPEGLDSIGIPAQDYNKITAKGKMPDCIANAWKDIWGLDMKRACTYDFEIYDSRSNDWDNAEIDIFVSAT